MAILGALSIKNVLRRHLGEPFLPQKSNNTENNALHQFLKYPSQKGWAMKHIKKY